MRRFLNRLIQTVARPGGAPRAARAAVSARPAVETLEDRTCPSAMGTFTKFAGIQGLPSPLQSQLLSARPQVIGPFLTPVMQGYVGNLVGTTGHLYRSGGDPVRYPSDNYGLLQSIANLQWDPNAHQYTFTATYVSTLQGSIATSSNPMTVTGTISGGNFAPFQIHFSGFLRVAGVGTQSVDYQGTVTSNGARFHTTGTLFDNATTMPLPTEGNFSP